MTPAGTPNELDVQNEWEENTHTHTHICQKNIEGHLIGLEILVYREPSDTPPDRNYQYLLIAFAPKGIASTTTPYFLGFVFL